MLYTRRLEGGIIKCPEIIQDKASVPPAVLETSRPFSFGALF